MFRLLQRMDDAAPRHAEGGGGVQLHVLKPVTVLADADETAAEALEDWARGLDWVHWLFSSVRHRMESLYLEDEWQATDSRLSELGSHLIHAWQAAEAGDLDELLRLDCELAQAWPACLTTRSLRAGELLRRSTKGARYQGVLGRLRTACDEGKSPGHFLTVWAAVGHFFQLSVANVVAEYLRLELRMRGEDTTPEAVAKITGMTSQLLRADGVGLRLVGAEPEQPRIEATPS
jgi:hypothetical protein